MSVNFVCDREMSGNFVLCQGNVKKLSVCVREMSGNFGLGQEMSGNCSVLPVETLCSYLCYETLTGL